MLSGESKRASSTIVQHTFADGRHLVTCDPDLGVEFEMGTSQVLCRLVCLPYMSSYLSALHVAWRRVRDGHVAGARGLEDSICRLVCLPNMSSYLSALHVAGARARGQHYMSAIHVVLYVCLTCRLACLPGRPR